MKLYNNITWYEKVIPMLPKYATGGMNMPYQFKKSGMKISYLCYQKGVLGDFTPNK